MTSRERVIASINHKYADRIPRDFSATGSMSESLMKHYSLDSDEKLREKFNSDLRTISPEFTGRKLETYIDKDGLRVEETMFGYRQKYHPTGIDFCPMNIDFPWDLAQSADDIANIKWLHADDFDYEEIKRQCDNYKDKAICIGGAGMYQYSTFLRSAEKLYEDMALEPELALAVFNKFVDFELEYYERQFIAGDGQVNILLCNDDYGTQCSMLFSVPMWRDFFKTNTKRIADLAHK